MLVTFQHLPTSSSPSWFKLILHSKRCPVSLDRTKMLVCTFMTPSRLGTNVYCTIVHLAFISVELYLSEDSFSTFLYQIFLCYWAMIIKWSIQKSKWQYRNHLVGQLTRIPYTSESFMWKRFWACFRSVLHKNKTLKCFKLCVRLWYHQAFVALHPQVFWIARVFLKLPELGPRFPRACDMNKPWLATLTI